MRRLAVQLCHESKSIPARSPCLLGGHLIAHALEAFDESALGCFGVSAVEVCFAEIAVGDVVAQEEVGSCQDLMRDGHGRALLPGARHEAPVLRAQIRSL